MKTRNLTIIILVAIAISILSGCARQPQPTAAELKEILQTVRGQKGSESRPALDLTGNPSVAINIDGDSVGIKELLAQQLRTAGVNIIDDPSQAQVVISGELQFVGDPADAPENAGFNDLRKKAAIGGAATTVLQVGMKMASPMSLVSGGLGLLTSAASKAMSPSKLQGVVILRVKQNGKLWDINLTKVVEGPKDGLNNELAKAITQDAIKALQG